jgi:hypothetical protein
VSDDAAMKTKTALRGDKALVDQKALILALPHEQVNAKGSAVRFAARSGRGAIAFAAAI